MNRSAGVAQANNAQHGVAPSCRRILRNLACICCQEARCWAMHAHVARPAAADGADILRHICWTAIDRTTLLDHEDGLSHTMRSKLPAKAAWSNILASGSTARGSRIDRELVSRSWSCQCVCPVPRRADQAMADAIHSRTVHWPS